MPSYPDVSPIYRTDIVLHPQDRDGFRDEDIVVRSIFIPTSQTMTVLVIGIAGRLETILAERVIFSGAPETPVESPETAPETGTDCQACGSFIMPQETTCGHCGVAA